MAENLDNNLSEPSRRSFMTGGAAFGIQATFGTFGSIAFDAIFDISQAEARELNLAEKTEAVNLFSELYSRNKSIHDALKPFYESKKDSEELPSINGADIPKMFQLLQGKYPLLQKFELTKIGLKLVKTPNPSNPAKPALSIILNLTGSKGFADIHIPIKTENR